MASKQCSCRRHHILGSADSPVNNISTSKKLRKCAIKYLIDEGDLENYHKYLCDGCYQHGLICSTTAKLSFAEFCLKIENNNLNDEEFVRLSTSYGKLINLKLCGVKSEYSIQYLKNMNTSEMFNGIEEGIKCFFQGVSKAPVHNNKLKIINCFENLVSIATDRFIGPLNFSANLISYFISGSRKIVEINSSFSPSGSYATVLDFLKNKAMEEQSVPNSDCIYFFDNNQIMARSWRVKFNSKPLISVITTIVCLKPPNVSTLQNCDEYSPRNWLSYGSVDDAENVLSETSATFRGYRNVFLTNEIKKLVDNNECSSRPSKLRKIDFESGKPKCSPQDPSDPYSDIESFVCGETTVILLDPVMVNPCSYHSLVTVLDNIVAKATTKWVAIGCDGLPYNLCSKMIDNYYICPHCSQTYTTISGFQHHLEQLDLICDIKDCKKYANILLLPGFGHFDINITKALFKLLWKVCLKDLVVLLGWKSIKAQTACEHCTDHHKATQILNILHESLTKALLYPFVKDCVDKDVSATVESLFEFLNHQSDCYLFLFKCNFTYLQAWKMLKKGMRRANFPVMKMCLDKLSMLFYGLNMTTYMEIWLRFEVIMLKAPESVKTFIERNICMSQSGHGSKAEGGDFILESTNKKIKTFMPSGVPTDDRWSRVCRNITNIEKIQDALKSKASQTTDIQPNPYFRHFRDSEAVAAFTDKLVEYVAQTGDHTSISGQPLDSELVNFDEKCGQNKLLYYKSYPDVLRLCEKVFITEEDRSAHFDISNKTKADIKEAILEILKNMDEAGGSEEADIYRKKWAKEVKTGTKNVLLTIHSELAQCLEMVMSRTCEKDTEEDDDIPVLEQRTGR